MWPAIVPIFSRTRRGEHEGAAADHHAPARERSAAVGTALGVALDDGDGGEVHAQLVGQDLGERSGVALALRGRAHESAHLARGLDAHGGRVVTGDLHHAAAAERARAHPGELRVRAEADALVLAGGAPSRLGAKPRVVDGGQGALERVLRVAAVDDQPGRRGKRQLGGVDEVPPADVGGVEAGAARDHVDHALAHEGAQRHPDAAVGPGRALVRRHRVGIVAERAHPIGPGQDPGRGERLERRGDRIDRVGPGVADQRRLHREDRPVPPRRTSTWLT
jgi:hypothetical protein